MNSTDNILLYQAPGGQTQLEVQLDHETVWLSQAQMVELFDVSKKTIKCLGLFKQLIKNVMLSLSKHLYRSLNQSFNEAVEILRQAQHDRLIAKIITFKHLVNIFRIFSEREN